MHSFHSPSIKLSDPLTDFCPFALLHIRIFARVCTHSLADRRGMGVVQWARQRRIKSRLVTVVE